MWVVSVDEAMTALTGEGNQGRDLEGRCYIISVIVQIEYFFPK